MALKIDYLATGNTIAEIAEHLAQIADPIDEADVRANTLSDTDAVISVGETFITIWLNKSWQRKFNSR